MSGLGRKPGYGLVDHLNAQRSPLAPDRQPIVKALDAASDLGVQKVSPQGRSKQASTACVAPRVERDGSSAGCPGMDTLPGR